MSLLAQAQHRDYLISITDMTPNRAAGVFNACSFLDLLKVPKKLAIPSHPHDSLHDFEPLAPVFCVLPGTLR